MNIVVTVALLPALFGGGDSAEQVGVRAGDLATVPAAAHVRDTGSDDVTLAPTDAAAAAAITTTTVAPTTTTTTTAAPVRAATTTTAKPAPTTRAKPAPTTTAEPATTTTQPPATTTTSPPPAASSSEEGRATWYELEGARAGICAHKTLPFGTVVTVTNTRTGSSITCEVGDRGPFVDGYVIDLFRTDFERLAPTSQGWFPARLTW